MGDDDTIVSFSGRIGLCIYLHSGQFLYLYPEWPHRQGGCFACRRLKDRCPAEAALIYTVQEGTQGELPMTVGGTTGQLDLPTLAVLFIAGSGRLQLGVPHCTTSVDYCK